MRSVSPKRSTSRSAHLDEQAHFDSLWARSTKSRQTDNMDCCLADVRPPVRSLRRFCTSFEQGRLFWKRAADDLSRNAFVFGSRPSLPASAAAVGRLSVVVGRSYRTSLPAVPCYTSKDHTHTRANCAHTQDQSRSATPSVLQCVSLRRLLSLIASTRVWLQAAGQ